MQYKNITSILLLHKKKAASLRPLLYYIILEEYPVQQLHYDVRDAVDEILVTAAAR